MMSSGVMLSGGRKVTLSYFSCWSLSTMRATLALFFYALPSFSVDSIKESLTLRGALLEVGSEVISSSF
jgi:hypothetical protein